MLSGLGDVSKEIYLPSLSSGDTQDSRKKSKSKTKGSDRLQVPKSHKDAGMGAVG